MRAYIEMGIMHEGDEVIVPANTYIASIEKRGSYLGL
jgi:dTDP-4-amino-4,6-dideoxygalactose transaminase